MDQLCRGHEIEYDSGLHLERKPSPPPVSSPEDGEASGLSYGDDELCATEEYVAECDNYVADDGIITPEGEDAEAVVTGLLAQYTTLFDS